MFKHFLFYHTTLLYLRSKTLGIIFVKLCLSVYEKCSYENCHMNLIVFWVLPWLDG